MRPHVSSILALQHRALLRLKLRNLSTSLVRLLLAGISFALLLGAVAISPFALLMLNEGQHDWAKLGNVGEAYGAVSALLSALAITGVTASLLVQRRQARREHARATLQAHDEIMRLPYENPRYGQCWGEDVTGGQCDERLFYYVNSILNYWYSRWRTGDLPSAQLSKFAAAMFTSEVPRRYWSSFGSLRKDVHGARRRFFRLIDDEYRRAVESGPALRGIEPLDDEDVARSRLPAYQDRLLMVGIGLALGVVTVTAARKSRR